VRRFLQVLIGLVALAIIAFVFVGLINYFNKDIHTKSSHSIDRPIAGNEISVLNWNLGYAGLGKESDFKIDGGDMIRPPSQQVVRKNISGIKSLIEKNKSDIHLFQEISEPDMLTRGENVLSSVQKSLSDYDYFYSSDFRTKLIPTRWALRHGLASFTQFKTEPAKLIELPLEPTKLGGTVQRLYHIQHTGFKNESGENWVILNLHLSAFDEGGNVRLKQFDSVIKIADEFYQQGHHVVVGGDWNIQLSGTEFPTTTKEEFLFWRTKLPTEKILPGWQIVVDHDTPTMRSNERPYVKGENFTSIIDGYMVSPNVEVIEVETIDTNFEFTDHQPTKARFRSKK